MTNDRHERIYASGRRLGLPTLDALLGNMGYGISSTDRAEDPKKRQAQYDALWADLKQKGLC